MGCTSSKEESGLFSNNMGPGGPGGRGDGAEAFAQFNTTKRTSLPKMSNSGGSNNAYRKNRHENTSGSKSKKNSSGILTPSSTKRNMDNGNFGHSSNNALSNPNETYLKALFDFKARTDEDLSMFKNDLLLLLDDSDENWWYCRNKRSNEEGYVPSNHVAREKTNNLEEWFFGDLRRNEAEELLLDEMIKGCFIIRNAESSANNYSLSICDGTDTIKHYRIKWGENGKYFISTRVSFDSLIALVEYYRNSSDGLCCSLICCPTKAQPSTFGLSKNTWEEPRQHFRLTKKLGAGQFGEVWEALYKNTTLVAIKTLKPGTMSADEFLAEANIMKNLQHDNLVQLLAVCTDGLPLYIVTEYMKNGSLLDFLKNNRDKIKQRNMIDMTCQVAKGMMFLEQNKFIHRDLAARNILVSHDLKYKVADFGLARFTQEDEYNANEKSKFPIKWTAPEAAMYHKFSTKSDVWSYGVLIFEIFTYGTQPYLGMTNLETIQKVAEGYRMPAPSGCNPEVYKIMLKCWHSDPEKRPTFEFLYRFFDEFNEVGQSRYTDM